MHSTHDEVDLRLTISRREEVADGVVALELHRSDGALLPEWAPGAHVDLTVAPGVVRQYSLCGDPAAREVWRIAVLREPAGRGGSARVHERLHAGDVVDVRGPRNHFALEPAQRYVFVAGGIGITPILPMVGIAAATGVQWELHYGGRTAATMAFREELAAFGARVRLYPEDEFGLMPLEDVLGAAGEGTAVYCCGPEPLLRAVEVVCAGRPAGTLHVERFAPKEQGAPLLSAAFEVELAASGLTLTVPPDRSILEVVEEAGVEVLSSCREGTCGTCETDVIEGDVDHRDSLLDEEERAADATMFICVSRAACSRLVLDL
ncbi:PDR/VanB family oxidoreductase [Trujillonella humicola]|uniref:PDR/VanB family oxidoreductase n=1 Tax=Trujillonella humicola TaxID=3383699 RepID=UPI003906BC6B